MDSRLDAAAKQLSEHASRRRMAQGLAAFGLGALGLIGLSQQSEANKRQDCKDRCVNHCNPNKTKHECRRDCRRKCHNRRN